MEREHRLMRFVEPSKDIALNLVRFEQGLKVIYRHFRAVIGFASAQN
jgi:hypothetical protein